MSKTKLNFIQKVGLVFYNHRIKTSALWVLAVVIGILSYTTWMRKEGFPTIDVSIGYINVVSLDTSAENVDRNFMSPLVEAAKADSAVKEVSSTANEQGGGVQITYKDGTDVDKALAKIKEAVAKKIPANGFVSYIKVNAGKLSPEGDDILLSVHQKDFSAQQLDEITAKLATLVKESLPNVEAVHPSLLIEKAIDPVTGQQVSAQVRFDRFYDLESDGVTPSAILGIRGQKDVDQLKVYDEVAAFLKTEKVTNLGAKVSVSADFAEGIREQVSALQTNLFEGLAVVLLVSFLLISLRSSVVTALSMATTVLTTIGLLHIFGYTINTITLFALVLSLALIVDDTTIMVESIDAGLKKGKKFKDVVAESFRRVARASATGTLVTILAFAPMLFIGGVLGKFIKAIPVTIIISLVVSFVVSFIFIPLFMRFSYGRNPNIKKRKFDFVDTIESALGNMLSSLILFSAKKWKRSLLFKIGSVLVSLAFLVGGGMLFSKVGFNIFPAAKDANQIVLSATVKNRETATIEKTQADTDKILEIVQTTLGKDLKRITLSGQSGSANRDGFTATLQISAIKDRKTTSVAYANKLQENLQGVVPDMIITAESAGVGPPVSNFVVEINASDSASASRLANDLKSYLSTATLTRRDKTTAGLKNLSVTPQNLIIRNKTDRIIRVSGDFTAKDSSALVALAKTAITKEFNASRIEGYGLKADSISFNLGQEQENQDSFASMGKAAGPLFITMILVMALLFRSILQPLLILTALPFAVFGVALGLFLTKNDISFFSMLGVFALIGISLNNTILLTDYANQAKKEGSSPAQAIASALKERLRPLLTTSITSVLALLPLALNDPFWEGLAYALIFGLISSTILVLVVFPYFYLINESISKSFRTIFAKARKIAKA